MSWNYQKARWGYHELLVWKEHKSWIYAVNWHIETAITTVGRGSENYADPTTPVMLRCFDLANILPPPQSKRLLLEQSDLPWEPWFEQRGSRPRVNEC